MVLQPERCAMSPFADGKILSSVCLKKSAVNKFPVVLRRKAPLSDRNAVCDLAFGEYAL